MRSSTSTRMLALLLCLGASVQPAMAEKKYGPGVTDTEIKLGQTMPYSGPASGVSLIGRIQLAYFKMINAHGGVNGRKINLISLDDGSSPPKTVEQTRTLVEGEEVLAIYSSVGSGHNLAISKYLNKANVPQLMAVAGTPKLIDPVNLPWTTTFYSSLTIEAKEFAAFVMESHPDARVGVLYQNDENGRTYMEGMRAGFGDKAATMITKEIGFDLASPTIDSQILLLHAAGVDTIFFGTVAPKFAAQGIRKIAELGWKPQILLAPTVSTVATTLKPAGLENAVGVITTMFAKDPGDPKWANEPAMQEFFAFMKEWAPGEQSADPLAQYGYMSAQVMVDTLRRCEDDLTRANLLDKATHIYDYQHPLFIPGVKINITPEHRVPWKRAQMARFNGQSYEFIGDVITISE